MYIHISFRDRYNFNKGAKDIGSGAPDDSHLKIRTENNNKFRNFVGDR